MGQVSERVIALAQAYIGKTEVHTNDAPWLEQLMQMASDPNLPWIPGESYCIAALGALFDIACKEQNVTFPFARSLSTQQFYNNAMEAGYAVAGIPDVIHAQPYERGDICIFRLGHTGEGHAELVLDTTNYGLTTIGFNTSQPGGNQREGTGVFQKTRLFSNFVNVSNTNLWLRGAVKTSRL